jgi:acyl carrier protein
MTAAHGGFGLTDASVQTPMREAFVAPASYAQERVWFASQMAKDVPLYHLIDELRLPYPLSFDQLRDALAVVCERHETLRTSFRTDDGALMQVIHPRIEPVVQHVDLSTLPPPEAESRYATLYAESSRTEFSLTSPPLWRATFVERGEAEWMLIFVGHHSLVDGASELNLRAELHELCAAAVQGRPAVLPELRIQCADFATWQRDRLASGRLEHLLAFWRQELDGLPAVHGLPTDFPRPAERSFAGADLIFPLTTDIVEGAPGLARQAGATPFMVMLAAYAALIHQLSGRTDVVIGVPVAGREEPEVQPLIGMFVNMLVARIDCGADPTFGELLVRVRDRMLNAWEYQEMPFQKLVEALATHRSPGVPPLYQLGFNYLDLGFGARSAAAEDDLLLEVSGGLGRIEYNTALFTDATARDLARRYVALLSAVVADPSTRLSALGAASGASVVPAVAGGNPASDQEFIAPRTDAEVLVAEVWREVLAVPQVGALDDFFELGGHSLLALRVIARINAAVGIELPIQAFFTETSVAGVASQVEQLLLKEIEAEGAA